MKTKAHFIVALSNHGVAERRATYLAGQAFGKDKNPREIVQTMHDELDASVREGTTELNALKSALDKWPRDHNDAQQELPLADERRTELL